MPHRQSIHARGRVFATSPQAIPGIIGERPLTIYLPPGYDHSEQRYPVVYMFDGQNLFGDEGTFAGGWHIHRELDRRAALGGTAPVVIGVHHGPRRDEEMCPWPAMPGSAARADLLLDWLSAQLHPEVTRKLRVLAEPQHTLIGGSSMGGLLALYGAFRHQEIFGKALVMSPALWVGWGAIFSFVAETPLQKELQIYIDCGEKEGCACHGKLHLQQGQLMADLLEVKGIKTHWHPDPDGHHNEHSWGRRMPLALDFLLPVPRSLAA